MAHANKPEFLKQTIEHYDIAKYPQVVEMVDAMQYMAYSSREFIREMGAYLERQGFEGDSIVYEAYKQDVPIFVPAFSDCSAGFGLVAHQHKMGDKPKVSLDSAKDFYEVTKLKIANPT